MTAKPKLKWRKGWSRAPWETCNRAATPEPQKETDGA